MFFLVKRSLTRALSVRHESVSDSSDLLAVLNVPVEDVDVAVRLQAVAGTDTFAALEYSRERKDLVPVA